MKDVLRPATPDQVAAVYAAMDTGTTQYPIGAYHSAQAAYCREEGIPYLTTDELANRIEFLSSYLGVSNDVWRQQFRWIQDGDLVVQSLSKGAVSEWPDSTFGQFVIAIAERTLFTDDEPESEADCTVVMSTALGRVVIGCSTESWYTESALPESDAEDAQYSMAFDLSFVPYE